MHKGFAPPIGVALDEAIAPVHTAILNGINTNSRRIHRRRAVGISAVATVAAAAILVGSATGFGGTAPHAGASAQAAELLTQAAQTTITTSDPVVAAGQYLKITTHETALSEGSTTSGQSRPETTYAAITPQIVTVYVPADQVRGMWVVTRQWPKPTQFFGADGQAHGLSDWEARPNSGTVRVERGVGGKVSWSMPANDISKKPFTETANYSAYDYSTLPRDPQTLLTYFNQKKFAGSASPAQNHFEKITELLRAGTVPADLRATAYKALALIPGVAVTDKVANLDGRSGVAFGITDPTGSVRDELIVDPTTGQFIGERDVSLTADGPIPAGTTLDSTAVTAEVVNNTP